MHFNQLLPLVFAALATFTGAYEAEVDDAIRAGRDRLQRIPAVAQQTDSMTNCNMNQYAVKVYDSEESPELIRDIVETANLPIEAAWTPVSYWWPSAVVEIALATTRFQCNYNPDGAIVYSDIERRQGDGSPYSAADVSWTTYKTVCDAASQNFDEDTGEIRIFEPGSLRYLIHTDVNSDNADEVFDEFAPNENVVTFADQQSDGFLAFLGLNNGATVSSLLTFHNQELGGKTIRSVSAWKEGPYHILMWELQ
jgi:hypothetical protein